MSTKPRPQAPAKTRRAGSAGRPPATRTRSVVVSFRAYESTKQMLDDLGGSQVLEALIARAWADMVASRGKSE